eukprot:TRINITY_DN5_c0_g2_i1.p1 TRINITY_DN5_c0_g2~~TRINITY_DN5_c0_g2_i1.p1  ORF type:complete len:322 (+),score=102.73 TRINITY_DN5_c0_g2_i1:95-1060(+)
MFLVKKAKGDKAEKNDAPAAAAAASAGNGGGGEFKGNSGVAGPICKSGHCSEQGRRPSMEDTYVAIDDVNAQAKHLVRDKHRAFFAVFDGHGGRTAADMAKEHLAPNLFKESSFGKGHIEEALTKAFASTDKQIREKANKDNWTDGATAVCIAIVGPTLYVGNLGDAESVLQSKQGLVPTSTCVSFKHKPFDPAEKARVEAAGGRIFLGRVLGTLAVSRAFGDVEFKTPQNKASADFVSSEPYIAKIPLTPEHQFLIIACDGLWDKVEYQEAVNVVDQVKSTGKDPTQAAATLVKLAMDKGTMDNVTCLVVYFDWAGKKKP